MIITKLKLWAGVLLYALMMLGCQEPTPAKKVMPIWGQALPWSGQAFDILAEDLDGDRLVDLTVTDHGANHAQIFYQAGSRQWRVGATFDGVGFHPGNIIRWPGEPARFILSAEGDNSIRVLAPDRVTGFKVEHRLDELKPRYASLFRWPNWGDSLVLSPFDTDSLFLLKGVDPQQGKAAERIHVPLSEQPPSVLWPGRITVTDIDRDGSDDLLYATQVTRQVFVVQAPKQKTALKAGKKTKGPAMPIKPRLLAADPNWGGPSQVLSADLNGDGAVDLLVPDETLPGKINLLINDGKGGFAARTPIDSPNVTGVTAIKTGIDKDGYTYVVAAGYGALAIHQIPHAWTSDQPVTTRSINWKSEDRATALALQDLDGDGWLDLVLGRSQGQKTLWVQYGPLWEGLETISGQSIDLDKPDHGNEEK